MDYFSENKLKVLSNYFPSVASTDTTSPEPHTPYQNCKILLNKRAYCKELLLQDLASLKKDHKFRMSCGETELLIYLTQAMN